MTQEEIDEMNKVADLLKRVEALEAAVFAKKSKKAKVEETPEEVVAPAPDEAGQ